MALRSLVNVLLNNAFGFGGSDSCQILQRHCPLPHSSSDMLLPLWPLRPPESRHDLLRTPITPSSPAEKPHEKDTMIFNKH